jgi:hypothetical protein
MSKFQRSWALFGRSFQVLRENRKLLLFPIIISTLTLLIVAFFVVPLATMRTGYTLTDAGHWKAVGQAIGVNFDKNGNMQHTGPFYGIMAAIYLVSMFLTTFFNVAFYHEILTALNGQPVSIMRGFRFAASRIKAIAAWSLFSGLVGLLIKSIEERVGLVGRIVVRLIGVAWSVASVFAIPVIVREGASANPVQFLKSSARMLKKTWGESLIGYVGISAGTFLAFLPLLAVAPLAMLGWVFFWIGLAVWLVFLFVFVYVLGVAGQVYKGALYIYASEGVVPGPFDEDQMNMAWRVKSGKK